ncbi:MAG: hypothetical protein IKN54_02400, partial [Lachnospiraceae bacterium]|nr:hypothetical protein [Lachnospiraceae bacterium]
ATSSSVNVTNWMYDNHAPTLNQTAEVSFEKVNKEGTNYYYSTNSKATYKIRDDWSGVITNSELIATAANKREANTTSKTIVNMSVGTKPYVEVADLVGNTATLYLTADGTSWLQQTVPTLPTSDYITIIDWDGTSNGTSNYQSTLSSVTGGKKISVQSPRSVTSLKFGLKANQLLTDDTTDTTNLSGWIIRTSPLNDDDSDESNNFEDFYSLTRTGTDGDITVLEKNDDNEYEYTYTKTTTKWEEMSNAVQYFYAVNKAGLICHNPIIVEFAENPVPAISSKSYSQVYTLNNINYINNNTTITFASNKYSDNTTVVPITKAEFYIGNSNTPALTKDFTTSPVGSYTLTTSESDVLPTLSNNELKVKLYTATEESEKYPLTDTSQNLAASNSWMFDNVKPVIEYVKVNNISKGVGNNTEYWTTENTPQTALCIKFTETNTGVKVFDFAGSTIKLRADTVLTWNGSELSATDITINTTANKLTINDDNLIKTAAAGGEATLTNVDLTSETTGNSVNLVISDYVENASVAETNFITQNNTEISMFKYDNGALTVNSVSLEDMENDTGVAAENGFTNDEYVKATLSVTATSAGIYKITVDGASFDNTTLVNGKEADDATEGFTVSADGKTITLKTSNNTVNRILSGTNTVVISNAKLPSGDGDKTVNFTVTNLAERTSQAENNSIILDKTVPAWVGDGVYVADSNNNSATIYPHTSTASSGNVTIGGAVYFYTKTSINVAASVTDENRKASNVDLFIDSSTTPVSEYTSVAPGTHTVYAVDRAGNKSAVKTFYVVEDTTAPAAFEGYVTFAMPSDGNIYRGNADTESTKNYVIKQNDASSLSYQIITKLDGVTSSDKDVHGATRTALSSYGELVSTTSSSPIEYYKISGDSGATENVNTDWIAMPSDKTITVTLPKERNSSNITIELKDGCGNSSSYTVPVNWKVDNGITLGGKTLGSPLYNNAAKGITYYKGSTTPVISLTGFDDSCYYPDIEASGVSNTATQDYTLKTRVLALAANATPSRTDFDAASSTQLSPWSYLTLKQAGDTVTMTHNYPKYDVTTAYKLYYIVEDKLGNYTIEPINNGTNVLWMWDNTAPSVEVVQIATSPSIKINTVGNTNYYSANSKLKLNITDTQSGIKYDGVTTYSGDGVKNTKDAVAYPLTSINPNASNQLII